MDLNEIEQQTRQAVSQVLEQAKLKMGDVFVIGCSTSEVGGEKIGSASSMDLAVPFIAVHMKHFSHTVFSLQPSAVSI